MEAQEGPPDLRPLITRQMCWDMVAHDEVLTTLQELGMVLGSDEGMAMEHQDSHVRTAPIAPYAHVIRGCAEIAAKVYSAMYFHPVDPEDLDGEIEDVKQRFDDQNEEIVTAAVTAVLAQLLDGGVIAVRGAVQ